MSRSAPRLEIHVYPRLISWQFSSSSSVDEYIALPTLPFLFSRLFTGASIRFNKLWIISSFKTTSLRDKGINWSNIAGIASNENDDGHLNAFYTLVKSTEAFSNTSGIICPQWKPRRFPTKIRSADIVPDRVSKHTSWLQHLGLVQERTKLENSCHHADYATKEFHVYASKKINRTMVYKCHERRQLWRHGHERQLQLFFLEVYRSSFDPRLLGQNPLIE